MEITKKTTMGELLTYDRGVAIVLMQAGMHCIGCPSSIHESLEVDHSGIAFLYRTVCHGHGSCICISLLLDLCIYFFL